MITPIGLSRIPLSGSMMDTVPVIWHLHVGLTDKDFLMTPVIDLGAIDERPSSTR